MLTNILDMYKCALHILAMQLGYCFSHDCPCMCLSVLAKTEKKTTRGNALWRTLFWWHDFNLYLDYFWQG